MFNISNLLFNKRTKKIEDSGELRKDWASCNDMNLMFKLLEYFSSNGYISRAQLLRVLAICVSGIVKSKRCGNYEYDLMFTKSVMNLCCRDNEYNRFKVAQFHYHNIHYIRKGEVVTTFSEREKLDQILFFILDLARLFMLDEAFHDSIWHLKGSIKHIISNDKVMEGTMCDLIRKNIIFQ